MTSTNSMNSASSPTPVSLSPSPPASQNNTNIDCNENSNNKFETKPNPLLLLQQTCNSIGSDIDQKINQSANNVNNNSSSSNSCNSSNNNCNSNLNETQKLMKPTLKRSPTSSDDDMIAPAIKMHKDIKGNVSIRTPTGMTSTHAQQSLQMSPTQTASPIALNYSPKQHLYKQQQQQQQQLPQQISPNHIKISTTPIDFNNNSIERKSKSPIKSPNVNLKKSPIMYQNQIKSTSPLSHLNQPSTIILPQTLLPTMSAMPSSSSAAASSSSSASQYYNNTNHSNDPYYNIRSLAASNPQLSTFYDHILTSMYQNNQKIDYANINAAAYAANLAQYKASSKHSLPTTSPLSTPPTPTKRRSVSPITATVLTANTPSAGNIPMLPCTDPYCNQCLLTAALLKKDGSCSIPGCTQCKQNDMLTNKTHQPNLNQKLNDIHECCWLMPHGKCGKLFTTVEELDSHVTKHYKFDNSSNHSINMNNNNNHHKNESSHLLNQHKHSQQQQQQQQQHLSHHHHPHPQQVYLNNTKLISNQKVPNELKSNSMISAESLKQQSELLNSSSRYNHYHAYGNQLIAKNQVNKPSSTSAFNKPQSSSNSIQLSSKQQQQQQQQQQRSRSTTPISYQIHSSQQMPPNPSIPPTGNNLLLSSKLPFNSAYSANFLSTIPGLNQTVSATSPTPMSPAAAAAAAAAAMNYPYANHPSLATSFFNSSINPIYDHV